MDIHQTDTSELQDKTNVIDLGVVFDELSNYILVSICKSVYHMNRKKLPYEARATLPACVLGRSMVMLEQGWPTSVTLLYPPQETIGCRWSLPHGPRLLAWKQKDEGALTNIGLSWLQKREAWMHQYGLFGLGWAVRVQLPAGDSASNPRDSSRLPASCKRTGARCYWRILFAAHTELKLQGTAWIRSASSAMLFPGQTSIQEECKVEWVSASVFQWFWHSCVLSFRQLLSTKTTWRVACISLVSSFDTKMWLNFLSWLLSN